MCLIVENGIDKTTIYIHSHKTTIVYLYIHLQELKHVQQKKYTCGTIAESTKCRKIMEFSEIRRKLDLNPYPYHIF